jgi:phage gp29-like protein
VAASGGGRGDYCRATLSSVERFHDALDHLANAIGYGIAVSELVWDSGRLIDVVPVPYSRLVSDVNEPWRLRVRTEEDASVGVALDEQPAKWIVHQPRPTPGRHFEGGLLRASVLLYLAQNLSFKDWLIYSQIAGMPVRVGRFEPGTPEGDKQQLLKMLQSLGTDAVAILSKNIELQMFESARSGDKPYQPLQEYCNNEVTILWLGQHLTTDLRGEGSRAAAEIHDRVREDLLVDDIADESQAIRRDLLTPLVRARFGDGVAVPHLRRSLIQSVDTKVLADTLAVAVRELGLKVPQRWVHRALGIPEPAEGEPVLSGGSQS